MLSGTLIPQVFDLSCRLFFYDGVDGDQRFLAVPDDRTVLLVLRGIMRSRVPTVADRGRLLGVRYGSEEELWPSEAEKVGLGGRSGYRHDLIQFSLWEPLKIFVPDRVEASWPLPERLED
jgi:hypothetical protein